MSLVEMLQVGAPSQRNIPGIVIAIVTNNKDPENLGRVKVMYPWRDSEDESDWARVMTFMAGSDRGGYFLPEVDDEVVVSFDGGDIEHPVILGSLWSTPKKSPDDNSDGENNRRIIKSRSGHIFRFDDKDGNEKIEVIDKTGNNSIVIDTAENTITVTSAKDIILKAPDGQVLIDAREINLKSSKATTIEAGTDIDIEASIGLSGKATNVKLKSSANTTLEAGVNMDVKASAILTAKGTMIQLN